jgi:flagellar basal body rod protein FlgC
MTDMIIAQRSFQANTNVLNRARETYERTLEIGQ